MLRKKILKLPPKEGEVKCSLPIKKITKKEAKELERIRSEYSIPPCITDSEVPLENFTLQSRLIDYLIEEEVDNED